MKWRSDAVIYNLLQSQRSQFIPGFAAVGHLDPIPGDFAPEAQATQAKTGETVEL